MTKILLLGLVLLGGCYECTLYGTEVHQVCVSDHIEQRPTYGYYGVPLQGQGFGQPGLVLQTEIVCDAYGPREFEVCQQRRWFWEKK